MTELSKVKNLTNLSILEDLLLFASVSFM